VIGVLLAVMLAGGMVTGAVLGPASASPLLSNTEIIQRALALIEAGAPSRAQASGTARPSASPSPTPQAPSATENAARRAPASAKGSRASASQSLAPSPSSSESGASEKSTSEGSGEGEKAASGRPPRLPPIQHVWLVVLDGSTFADATAAASGYPYLVGQLIKRGALLTSYSALDGYELAGDAALLPGGIGASVRPISEPGCDSSPATGTGASCAPGAPRTPAEADAFAQRLVGPILSSPAYHENGLVVITFAPASEEAGVPVSTLALQPTAGALLLSPLLHGGARSATPFNPISPRTSLETVFGH
jgi:hypothetical protein